LFGLVLASASGQTLQNREIVKTSSGKNGVTVEVSLPEVVSTGQPVEMAVKITNSGSHTVYYARVDEIRELRIHLVESRNVVPELTPKGKKVIDVPEIYYSYRVEALRPGEHYEWRVDLGTLFKLKAGKYQVCVNLDFNGAVPGVTRFEISTDPLGFAVQ
jgi:hypothetical protein